MVGIMRFSIIVPIYNREKVLEKCIDSLINQTFKDIEIILIDDGSDDRSFSICKSYEEKDKRVRSLHVKQGGVSRARNTGIALSNGEYLIFVDSDDYVEKTMCERFNDIIMNQNPDVIIGGYHLHCKSHTGVVRVSLDNSFEFHDGKEYLIKAIKSRRFKASVWGNVFKNDGILGERIRFDEELSYHEDMDIMYRLLANVHRIFLSDDPLYHYMLLENSLMYSDDNAKKKHDDMVVVLKRLLLANDSEADKCSKDAIYSQISKCFINSCIYNRVSRPSFTDVTIKHLLTYEFGLKERINVLLFILWPQMYIALFDMYVKLFNDGIRHINIRKWCNG